MIRLIIFSVFTISIFFAIGVLIETFPLQKIQVITPAIGGSFLASGLAVDSVFFQSLPNITTHLLWFIGYSILLYFISLYLLKSKKYIFIILTIILVDFILLIILGFIFGLSIKITFPIVWILKLTLTIILCLFAYNKIKWGALFIPLLLWEVLIMFNMYINTSQYIPNILQMIELPIRINEGVWIFIITLCWLKQRCVKWERV